MAKSMHYCCDPRHATPCPYDNCAACPAECDPNAIFYGTKPQAEAKLARLQKAEQQKTQ